MPNFTIHFLADPDADPTQLCQHLASEIKSLPTVDAADAAVQPGRMLDAQSITAIISVTAMGFTALSQLIDSMTKVVNSTKGLKTAVVDIEGQKIPVAQLTPDDLKAVAH
jgi:hypothetical protein